MKSQAVLRLCYSTARHNSAVCASAGTLYQVNCLIVCLRYKFNFSRSHDDGLVYMNIKARKFFMKIISMSNVFKLLIVLKKLNELEKN
jgi:hypothetical protein